MPEVSRFFGIVIAMFYDDHHPPHFHARYGRFKVEIDIRGRRTLAGYLPPKEMALVLEWADLHQDELMQDWERAWQQVALRKIAPLE